jgi:hypothetical protein
MAIGGRPITRQSPLLDDAGARTLDSHQPFFDGLRA